MELLLFLIIGGYFLLRCCAENAGSRIDDRNRRIKKAERDRWIDSVTNKEVEQELELFISRPENRDKVLEEVAEVYDGILAGKRLDEVYPREFWCKCKKGWSWQFHERVQELICRRKDWNALRILMAKRGYLIGLDAISGAFKNFSASSRLEYEVIIWCANELKKHGVKEKFVAPECGLYGVCQYGTESNFGWEI